MMETNSNCNNDHAIYNNIKVAFEIKQSKAIMGNIIYLCIVWNAHMGIKANTIRSRSILQRQCIDGMTSQSLILCLHFCKYLEMIRHIVLRYYMMNVTCDSLYCNQSSIVSVTQCLIVCDNITTTTRNRTQSNLYHQEILWCQVCFLGYETLLIIWEIRFHFF